jgi:N6-adenosine-specific RNA methylase IME4
LSGLGGYIAEQTAPPERCQEAGAAPVAGCRPPSLISAPHREHSRKPEVVYELPDLPARTRMVRFRLAAIEGFEEASGESDPASP